MGDQRFFRSVGGVDYSWILDKSIGVFGDEGAPTLSGVGALA